MTSDKRSEVYSALPDSSSMRLITVHSQATDQIRISCDLDAFCISEAPTYAALSYTWGAENFKETIIVNGAPILVTESCCNALVAFRDKWHDAKVVPRTNAGSAGFQDFRKQHTLRIWVDQLCISQIDDAEKTQQILLMKRIYSGATTVWAWTESPSSSSGFESFDSQHADAASTQIETRSIEARMISLVEYTSRNVRKRISHDDIIRNRKVRDATAWFCLFTILSRPYWHRRWIIQEINAREDAFVLFEDYLICVDALHNALGFLRLNYLARILESELSTPPHWYAGFQNACRHQTSLYNYPEMRFGHSSYKAEQWHYLFLLTGCGWSETSRDEDTFFALRSFATESNALPVPRYGQKLVDLYLQHAEYFVTVGLTTQLLQYSGYSWRRTVECPSWCPDFLVARFNDSLTRLRLNINGPMRHSFFQQPSNPFQVQISGNSLHASVALKGRLVCKQTVDPMGAIDLGSCLQRGYKFVKESQSHITSQASQEITAIVHGMGARSVHDMGTKGRSFRHPLAQLSIALQAFLVPLAEEAILEKTNQARLGELGCSRLYEGGFGRKHGLFVTDSGLLGIGSRYAQSGDQVVLFPGCWLPMLIRPTGTGQYTVVADAFILGLQGRYFTDAEQQKEFCLGDSEMSSITLV